MSVPGRAERLLQDPALTSAEIHDLVAARLDEVETLFRDNLASPVRIVGDKAGHQSTPTTGRICGTPTTTDFGDGHQGRPQRIA